MIRRLFILLLLMLAPSVVFSQTYESMLSDGALLTRHNGDGNGDATSDLINYADPGTNDGSWDGASAYGTPPTDKGAGSSFDIGSGSAILVSTTFSTAKPFSVTCWFKGSSSDNETMMAERAAYAGSNWAFQQKTTGVLRLINNLASVESTGTINDGNWHFCAATVDGSGNVKLYIDGAADGTGTMTWTATAQPYSIGAAATNASGTSFTNAMSGECYDARIYTKELSLAEVQAIYAGPSAAEAAYASPTLRKSLNMAADGGAWNWQRAFVQDAAVLSNPVEAGDIIVRRESDGLQVPAIVTQSDADGIDVNVLLPLTLRSTYEQYYLDVATAGTAAATSWPSFGVRQAAPTSAIDGAYTVYTGEDETGSSTSSAEFVHPFVVKVPSGSWASHLDSDLDGEVTHLIADTPYPGSNADYENPVLFYSTDDCATRARVPSTSIPWPLDGVPASGSNKDVCAFFLPESGDLIVSWKNPVDEAKFARISGTHLTDAAVDSEWSNAAVNADVGSEFIVANSYIALSDNRVRAFFTSPAPNDTDGCGSIYYRDTTNFLDGASATWTAEQQVSLAGGELDKGWWHGGICHDGIGGPLHDGYYYLIFSEGAAGAVATFGSGGSHARLFRSRSIDGPWEPALDVLLAGGASLAANGVYQVCISEDAAGKPFAVCSMRDASGDYAVGRTAVDLRRTLVPTATAYNQGWGSSSVYATASPLLAAVDFQRDTLSDASGNGNDAVLTGSPTQTEGVGVVLDGSTQYITLGSSDLLGGESFVDMGGLFTFPATFATGASQGVLCDDNPGAGGSFEYGFRFWVDPSTGKVTDFFWHNGTTAQGNSTEVGPDLRGGTHFIRVLYDAANGDAKLWIDGATYQTVTVTGSLRSNAAKRLRIGCDGGGSNFLDCTCHYFYVRTGGGPDYTFYRGGRGYALPAAETTTPKPLQQFPVFGR